MPDDVAYQIKHLLFRTIQGEMSYSKACKEIDSLLAEDKKEKEKLKRRIFGLETTVRNFKEKEQKMYFGMSWRKD